MLLPLFLPSCLLLFHQSPDSLSLSFLRKIYDLRRLLILLNVLLSSALFSCLMYVTLLTYGLLQFGPLLLDVPLTHWHLLHAIHSQHAGPGVRVIHVVRQKVHGRRRRREYVLRGNSRCNKKEVRMSSMY